MSKSISLNELYDKLQEKYFNDIEIMKREGIRIPQHYYSFRVYLAYNNCWKIILRYKIKSNEINVMKQLNIYKPSRSEIGTRRKSNKDCIMVI